MTQKLRFLRIYVLYLFLLAYVGLVVQENPLAVRDILVQDCKLGKDNVTKNTYFNIFHIWKIQTY